MIKYVPKPKVKLPPGPKGKGIMGNTKQFIEQRFEMMRHCAEDYEGIAFARIAFRNIYIVSKPEYVAHVLQKNAKNYHKSANYEGLRPLLGNGLLTNEGDSWFKHRRLLQPSFHRERLAAMTQVMIDRTKEAVEEFSVQANAVDVGHEMRRIAADIVTRALFGTDADGHSQEVTKHIQVLLAYANDKIVNPFKLPLHYPTSSNKKVRQAIEDLDGIILGVIEKRRKSTTTPRHDLLQLLLEATDQDTGEQMNDQQVRDEVMTIYLAGQETTQHALTFALHLLEGAPKVVERLRQEALDVYGNKSLKPEHAHHLPYTAQVLKEVMRLYPPIWAVSRRPLQNDQIGAITIPKDSTVFIPIWAIHRHCDHWEAPLQFNPDRFEVEKERSLPKNTYFPFGSGPRICIGNHFAMLEMQVILSQLMLHFNIERTDDAELELVTNMTMRPKNPVMMCFSKR